MERIIKFRCWNIANKSMHAWQDIADAKQDAVWFWLYLNANAENNILMQFTGLTDKNGVEIYEGDILHLNYEGIRVNGEVKQKESGTWIMENKEQGTLLSVHHNIERVTVIGNIYENNNLLTQQKQ